MSTGAERPAARGQEEAVSEIWDAAEPFPRIDASGIFAPLKPPKYAIQAIDLCPGAPAIWAGYGFVGKTVSAQAAALAIAAGCGTVWGCFEAAQGRVLHVDFEQGRRLTCERYQRLAVGLKIAPAVLKDQLSLVTMPLRFLDHAQAEEDLRRLVDGFGVVIIDSLKAATPTVDENSSELRGVLDKLMRVSERTQASVVVLHHARKASRTHVGGPKTSIRGSGAAFDACGSALVFEGQRGRPVRVFHEKARTSGVLLGDFQIAIADVPDDSNPRAGLLVTASPCDSREVKDRCERPGVVESAQEALRRLFLREPEQRNADEMARRIRRKAEVVREALNGLIVAGKVIATGTTADRQYRWAGTFEESAT